MRRTAVLALALGASSLALAACGGADTSPQATTSTAPGATVTMTFSLFGQDKVDMKAGETLTFVNDNPIEHEIVQGEWEADASTGLRTSETDDGTYSLKVSKKGDTVSHVYDKAGTYEFFCTIHKAMNGSVTVS